MRQSLNEKKVAIPFHLIKKSNQLARYQSQGKSLNNIKHFRFNTN
jgi:hypothetical protein